MRKLNSRYQRTIHHKVEIQGVGYLTGNDVTLRFKPAPPNTGIIFIRTDLHPKAHIPAQVAFVTGTNRRTSLGHHPHGVTLVEHVLSALYGLRIDNCFVELDSLEPPGPDGSARPFVQALLQAGEEIQPTTRDFWTADAPVLVEKAGATMALYPAEEEELRITYTLDYGAFAPFSPQRQTKRITPQSYINEIASCRTFLLEEEAQHLIRQGFGRRTSLSDLVVFGRKGLIDNSLRFADEPARHKILDILGDLCLSGLDLRGHIVAYRSGHPLNVELARQLRQRLGTTVPRLQAA